MSIVRTLIGNVKGPKGDTGSQGPQGVAGTIEIGSVQTVSYGSPASVTNSGTEEEAILDFQIPQGAPGAQVTDMSNLVLSTITDSTADYPTFAVSETGSTIFGKIRKFLSDLKANYVSKSMMTISTDVDTAGQAVADAKAIKTLNDDKANKSAPELYFKIGTQDGDPQTSYPHVELRSSGNATSGRSLSATYAASSSSNTYHTIIDKNGNFVPEVYDRYSGICSTSFVVGGGSSVTINLEANARFLIVMTGRYNTHQGLIVGGTNGSGAVAIKIIEAASAITVDSSTAYKLKFTNSHGSNASDVFVIMYGDTKTVNT